jgi:hypothetical protein
MVLMVIMNSHMHDKRVAEKGRAWFQFMVMLGNGADILSGVAVLAGGDGAWP